MNGTDYILKSYDSVYHKDCGFQEDPECEGRLYVVPIDNETIGIYCDGCGEQFE